MSKTNNKKQIQTPKAEQVQQRYPKKLIGPIEDIVINSKFFGLVVDKTISVETKFDLGNGWIRDNTISNTYRHVFGFIKYLRSYRDG